MTGKFPPINVAITRALAKIIAFILIQLIFMQIPLMF